SPVALACCSWCCCSRRASPRPSATRERWRRSRVSWPPRMPASSMRGSSARPSGRPTRSCGGRRPWRPAGAATRPPWRRSSPPCGLTGFARDPDPAARAHAVYSLARLRIARAVPTLLGALADAESYVRAVALPGVTRALGDSAQIAPPEVIARIRPLLGDRDGHVRVNALRALASFQDSGLVGLALPLVTDRDVNVAVQA